ncbi:APC family permease [Alteribacillus bidgolensis]|uniref:Putrescine:proton symporter, AAT family n=1 Tax=Alteribacillus bidgolensis TaxID=930129 RepID=A0A1G8NMY3_9BACI|nr:APC family permease [Alteribacillus bidgolensis]SDI81619.1 putrescine:proton symporter, AAT family [Alteribacillus bidgolensis]
MKEQGELQRQLTLMHVIVMGLAYMSPFAVFDTFGIVSEVTSGHVPTAYILVFTAILFTAFSYGKMVKRYPVSGSVYTYTQKTMNPHIGFIVGWITFLAYLALPMINALLARIYLSAGFPNIPEWIWIVGLIAVITVLNIIGLKIATNVNLLLVLFQFVLGITFVLLTINSILNEQPNRFFSADALISESLDTSTLFAGAALLALSFIGFDAITTLSEETIHPKKVIPKGIFLVALIGGIFFFTVTYFMQSLYPDVSSFNDIEGASPEIAQMIGGNLFLSFFIAGALVSVLASGMAAQTSASRLLYAMGRDGIIPKRVFGYVHPRFNTPIFNIIIIGVLALSALMLNLTQATSLINFGAFTAFSFVNLCVIVHYFRYHKERSFFSMISYVVFPLIGLGFVLYLWISLDLFSITLGMIWSLLGIGYLFFKTNYFTKEPPQVEFEELDA